MLYFYNNNLHYIFDMPIVSNNTLRKLLKRDPPLVQGLIDIDVQVQPCGIDLTVKTVASFDTAGTINFNNERRIISSTTTLPFNESKMIDLPAGSYLITYNESVHIPNNLIALGFPRSSLLRCGVDVHTALWDAGYSGRSQSMLTVNNPHGFILHQNARVLQLIFISLDESVHEGYNGIFQRENI